MNRRALQLGAGLAALAALCVLAEALPTWRRLGRLGARCEAARTELLLVGDRPKELARQGEELNKVKQFVRKHVKPIPKDSDVAGLVRSLSELMDSEGISRREIATGVEARGESARTLPLTLKMRGSFASVCAVIDRIESLPRMVRLRRVELRLDGEPGAGEGVVAASLLVELVYAKEGASG